MVNAEVRTLHEADGTPVCNVSFDLSTEQLAAGARAVEAVRLDRHRDEVLGTDDVLALRQLTSLSDELQGLAEQGGHASLVLPLARFVALHDALGDWVHAADERGWMREDEQAGYELVDALLHPMGELRAEAVRRTLDEDAGVPRCDR